MRHRLESYDDESSVATLDTRVRLNAESIEISSNTDDREIVVETLNGKIQIRIYDGEKDSPLSVNILPAGAGIDIDREDYDSE